MNLLAHLYFSGSSEEVMIGNFIGDWVKGHDYRKFPEGVKKGILLHRLIDDYTDHHPMVRKSKEKFYDQYHKMSGILVDVFYDYYLSKEWSYFSNQPLDAFLGNTYRVMLSHYDILPENVKSFLPAFVKKGWFYKYSSVEGIREVLYALSKKTFMPETIVDATHIFEEHIEDIRQDFYLFIPDLISIIKEKHGITISLNKELPYKIEDFQI